MTHIKLSTVADLPDVRRTGDGRYEVRRHTADDGYVTWRIYLAGGQRYAAEEVYERDVRPAIAAHIDSAGATWHPHLVHGTAWSRS